MRIQMKIKHTFIYFVILLAGVFLRLTTSSLVLWILSSLALSAYGAFCLAILDTGGEREVS